MSTIDLFSLTPASGLVEFISPKNCVCIFCQYKTQYVIFVSICEFVTSSWPGNCCDAKHFYIRLISLLTDILKVYFLRGPNFSFEILCKKKVQKLHLKPHNMCEKLVKMRNFQFAHSILKNLRKLIKILRGRTTVRL